MSIIESPGTNSPPNCSYTILDVFKNFNSMPLFKKFVKNLVLILTNILKLKKKNKKKKQNYKLKR